MSSTNDVLVVSGHYHRHPASSLPFPPPSSPRYRPNAMDTSSWIDPPHHHQQNNQTSSSSSSFKGKLELGFRCEVCGKLFEHLSDLKNHLWAHTTKDSGLDFRYQHVHATAANTTNSTNTKRDSTLASRTQPEEPWTFARRSVAEPLAIVSSRAAAVRPASVHQHHLSSSGAGLGHGGRKGSAPCSVCGKCFAFKNYLQIHQRVHTKEKPYACDLCPKRFSQASSRNRHRKGMHRSTSSVDGQDGGGLLHDQTKIGPPCSICAKRFPCKSLLDIHMRVHTKEKPYSCDLCFRRYTQVSSRNFHRRRIHKDALAPPLDPSPALPLAVVEEITSPPRPTSHSQHQLELNLPPPCQLLGGHGNSSSGSGGIRDLDGARARGRPFSSITLGDRNNISHRRIQDGDCTNIVDADDDDGR